MFFRELINAINSLRDSVLVLAQAVRESWAGEMVEEYDEGDLFAKIKARIEAEKPSLVMESDLVGHVEPGGRVFYASEDAQDRQSQAEEIEEYFRQRGYGVEARKEAKEIISSLE